MVKQYSPEILALRDRVKLGSEKLFKAWQQIRELAHNSEEWARQMELWHQATRKLSMLCTELELKGYADCLYLDDSGKKTKRCLDEPDQFWCQVCPSSRDYWEQELMELPSPGGQDGKVQ